MDIPHRIAIVGAGAIARWHADAAIRCGATVRAIVEPRLDAARAMAHRFPLATIYPSIDALVADSGAAGRTPRGQGSVNVLHICTPSPTHAALVTRGLEAGLHVLVEKPLSQTLAQTTEVLRMAESRGLQLCPVHQYLFQRGFVRWKRRRMAALGAFAHVEMTACSAGADGRPDTVGRELLGDLLPHALAVLHDVVGPLRDLEWHVAIPGPGELRAHSASGPTSIAIVFSLAARPTESSLVVRAAHGTSHLDFFHGYAFTEPGRVSRMRKALRPFDASTRRVAAAGANLMLRVARREPAYPGLRELAAAFYSSIRTGGPPPIAPSAVLEVAAARERLLESAAGRF